MDGSIAACQQIRILRSLARNMLFVSRNRTAVESCTCSPFAPGHRTAGRSHAAQILTARQLLFESPHPRTRRGNLIEARLNDKGATVHRSKRMPHFSIWKSLPKMLGRLTKVGYIRYRNRRGTPNEPVGRIQKVCRRVRADGQTYARPRKQECVETHVGEMAPNRGVI